MQLNSLEADGAITVRGLLNDQAVRYLIEIVNAAFAYLDSGGGDQPMRDTWISVGTIWLPNLGRCGISSAQAHEFSSLLAREANRALGPSYLAADICSIRRMNEKRTRIGWHTDYDGGGTRPYDPCYNIWLPLTPVGREQPSVEVVRGSHRRMRELPVPSPHNGAFSEEWVAKYFAPAARLAPELKPGDALIFDHWTLHRTQILDRDRVSRASIECRVTQQAAYLAALELQ
jgi:hypothetical protein